MGRIEVGVDEMCPPRPRPLPRGERGMVVGLNIGTCNLEFMFKKGAPFEHPCFLDATLYLRNKYEREEDVVKRGNSTHLFPQLQEEFLLFCSALTY